MDIVIAQWGRFYRIVIYAKLAVFDFEPPSPCTNMYLLLLCPVLPVDNNLQQNCHTMRQLQLPSYSLEGNIRLASVCHRGPHTGARSGESVACPAHGRREEQRAASPTAATASTYQIELLPIDGAKESKRKQSISWLHS